MHDTIARNFYHPQLKDAVDELVHRCSDCQRHKLQGRGYGHLPPREALFQPFYELAVDLIGPWTVTIQGTRYEFHAATMIDTVTGLTELVRIPDKTALTVARAVEHAWLYRYPRPVKCIHDQGPEFIGHDFQFRMSDWGIKTHQISVRNPQANAICERMHQTVANLIRVMIHSHPPANLLAAAHLVDDALATASYALRTTVHNTLGYSPGSIVFNRDMVLDVPYIADLHLLRYKRQQRIDHNLRTANNRRYNFDYVVGGRVLEVVSSKSKNGKLRKRTKGPYSILQVHSNGTLTIRRNGNLIDRVNIRRLRPFFD